MALFYFLRHGETAWNAEGRLCGRTDVALSDAGRPAPATEFLLDARERSS